ncbi:protein Shroom2-like [Mustelus asterias]
MSASPSRHSPPPPLISGSTATKAPFTAATGDRAQAASGSTFYHSPQDLTAEGPRHYDQAQARPAKPALRLPARPEQSPSPDTSGQNRYYCVTSRQATQAATRPSWVKVECWDGYKGHPAPSNNMAAPNLSPRPPRYQPSPPDNSRLEAGGRVRATGSQRLSEEERGGHATSAGTLYGLDHGTPQPYQLPAYSDGGPYQPMDPCWLELGEGVISPDRTPMLHSLAQESRSLRAPWAEGSGPPPLPDVNPPGKQQRRSDRFATALRNEIQMKRAQLQKSKSAAALTGTPEAVAIGNELEESPPNSASSSDGSSSTSYKDDLKEAQARVLRATSFRRRDLGPVVVPRQPPLPDRRTPAYPVPPVTLASPAALPDHPRAPVQAAAAHHLARVGGRKRLTPEQKLRSYSEPEKMNQVGVPDDLPIPQPGAAATAPPSSFADRRHFFEAGSKVGRPTPAYSRPPPPGRRPGVGGEAQWRRPPGKSRSTDAEECPSETEGRARASSLGCESAKGATDPGGSWPPRNVATQPSRHPQRPPPTGYLDEQDPSGPKAEPERLGTFAEYQASWREQRKISEARSSGKFHSADNILEQNCQESVDPQYVHGRSRSSPSSDFYVQEVPVAVRRRTEGYQKETERPTPTAGEGGRASLPARSIPQLEVLSCLSLSAPSELCLDSGSTENPSEGWKSPLEQNSEHSWSVRNAQASGNLPQEWHEPAVTMLSGQRYPGAGEGESERKTQLDHLQSCTQNPPLSKYWAAGDNIAWAEEKLAATSQRKGAAPTQPDKYRPQELPCSGPPDQPSAGTTETPARGTDLSPSSAAGWGCREPQLSDSLRRAHLGKVAVKEDNSESPAFHFIPKPPLDVPRSPSPQFAPQRLTDKPPLIVEDDNLARIEKVTENNMTVKKVPIKIVRSESQTEKESRHNLLNNVDLIGFADQERAESIGTCENPYSLFAAYSRQEAGLSVGPAEVAASSAGEDEELSPGSSCGKATEKSVEDIKSEELAREIVDKDRSLADILYPNSKMKTTMDLMEGIFPKDDCFLQEAQQRRKLLPSRSYSPKPTEEREEEILPLGASLTTSSTYYSTSAPKAELLNKMKDMQQQMEEEEESEDELNHDLTEKKQELIDSISKKLQVLRDARESLQDDIQANNLLGDEVEAFVKDVCKPNEFEKFRMFIGDLDKVVNLLLSLSGRLARVENALNTLEESASPDERVRGFMPFQLVQGLGTKQERLTKAPVSLYSTVVMILG